jgi:Cell division protein CrgA
MPKSRSKRQRAQPPPKPKPKQSPPWMGPLFFLLLFTGVAVIVTNYLSLYGGTSHPYLLWVGLGLITAALVLSTRWH